MSFKSSSSSSGFLAFIWSPKVRCPGGACRSSVGSLTSRAGPMSERVVKPVALQIINKHVYFYTESNDAVSGKVKFKQLKTKKSVLFLNSFNGIRGV